MKFKLNRRKNREKKCPNQSYRQFSSFWREKGGRGDLKIRWKKEKRKMERERREAASQADNRMKICMSRKICVSLSWFSSSPFFFFSRPNDAETGQKLKSLVRAKTVSKSNKSNGAVHPRTQIRYSRHKGDSTKEAEKMSRSRVTTSLILNWINTRFTDIPWIAPSTLSLFNLSR